MGELVIAAVAAPFGRDLDAGFRTIERALQEARVCGAGLVVLPEGALGGHAEPPHDGGGDDPPPALEIDGPQLRRVAQLARDLVVCVGFCEAGDGGARHDSAAVLSGDDVHGVHRKVHLSRDEQRSTTPGDRLIAFDTPVGRIGMLVGYDKAFPEAARTLALDGAQVLAFMSAWPCGAAAPRPQDDRQWRRAELWDRSRAAENSLIVASANQTGTFGSLLFAGGARVVDPGGDVVAATGGECGVACASFDVAASLGRARRGMSPIHDLRPDLYRVAAPLAA